MKTDKEQLESMVSDLNYLMENRYQDLWLLHYNSLWILAYGDKENPYYFYCADSKSELYTYLSGAITFVDIYRLN